MIRLAQALLAVLVVLLLCGCNQVLFSGAKSGNLVLVEASLASGADVNTRDELGFTPLHWAVKEGHPKVAIRFLDGGADANAKTRD